MTKDRAMEWYNGAKLRMADREWTLVVTGLEAYAERSAYRVSFDLAAGPPDADVVRGLTLDVRIPEYWPATEVLKALQHVLESGGLEEGTLVLADLPIGRTAR